MQLLEYVTTGLNLWATWLYVKQDNMTWPVGMVGVVFSAILFYSVRLYADTLLQLVYWFFFAYGWYSWSWRSWSSRKQLETSVAYALPRQLPLYLTLIGILGTWLLFWCFSHYSRGDLVLWDSLTAVMSLIALWMSAKKYLSCWFVWFAVDVMYIGIYLSKNLYSTAGLYTVYLVFAVMGYLEWQQYFKRDDETVPNTTVA